ncbi:MAG TPA: NADH-quinone oxidoreductase subunit L, partial [candidate division Zixibacteria bacterium]|nr:NADH-quinone oxidoreductase subunit L [candidate division Zixibacteria bacterium]
MLSTAWLIPVFPLCAMALIVLVTHRSRALSAGISITAIALGFLYAWAIAFQVWFEPQVAQFSFDWLNLGPSMTIPLGIRIDGLSAMMLIVVTTVALMVQVYSLGYMHGDSRYGWFYAVLSLFAASMLALVLADNFLLLYFAWEL